MLLKIQSFAYEKLNYAAAVPWNANEHNFGQRLKYAFNNEYFVTI